MERNKFITKLLVANNPTLLSISLLLLRITVGVILFVIGSGKVLGWFGGHGMETTIKFFVTKQGFTPLLTYMSAYTEFIGGFLLIVGLLTRPVAFAVMINMIVAGIVSLPRGFIAGAAYPFSLMISALIILLAGPMKFSLDSMLFRPGEVIAESHEQQKPIKHN
jgi:putative oxidoreductase